MVHLRSKVLVKDNSGVREVRLIQVYKGKFGHIGSMVLGSVIKVRPDSDFKKGDLVRGMLVSTKVGRVRKSGVRVQFAENAMVLLNKKMEPVGSRVLGVVPMDLRKYGQTKIVSRAQGVV
jgi:large subunit ribosomal protein L14